MQKGDKFMIGVIEVPDAKRMKDELAKTGIEVEVITDSAVCKKGCRPVVEVWGKNSDLAKIGEYLNEKRLKSLEGLDVNLELEKEVFDPGKESAVCPACGTKFDTKSRECPDCGLVFIPDELADKVGSDGNEE